MNRNLQVLRSKPRRNQHARRMVATDGIAALLPVRLLKEESNLALAWAAG